MAPHPTLIDGIAAGDPAAMAEAYGAFAARLYGVACRLGLSGADAEECVQEVFVSLAERGPRAREIDDLGAYLFASLHHAAATRARGRQRLTALHQRAAPAEEPHAPAPDASDLAGALAALPAEQREVVALKVDGGLTFAEIGALLGTGLHTAASRYRYALAKLKAALEEDP